MHMVICTNWGAYHFEQLITHLYYLLCYTSYYIYIILILYHINAKFNQHNIMLYEVLI